MGKAEQAEGFPPTEPLVQRDRLRRVSSLPDVVRDSVRKAELDKLREKPVMRHEDHERVEMLADYRADKVRRALGTEAFQGADIESFYGRSIEVVDKSGPAQEVIVSPGTVEGPIEISGPEHDVPEFGEPLEIEPVVPPTKPE